MNETKSWFLKRSIKSRDKKNKDSNIINQRKDFTTDSLNVKSIINLSINWQLKWTNSLKDTINIDSRRNRKNA